MRKRKSFFKRHIIGIVFLLLVALYSAFSTYSKQQTLNDLELISQEKIEKIRTLKEEVKVLESSLEQVNTPEFFERYAREKFKMIHPYELYFQMIYEDDEDE
jgi:cell division protein FtsB